MRNTETTQLERRNYELSILTTIAAALNREVDLARALQVALAHVADLLDLRTGWVWLLNERSDAPYLAAAQHLPPALTASPERMEGACYCLDTFQAGDLDGAANVSIITCSRLKKLVDGTSGLRYHASIPLYARGKKIGVMNVASPDWRELSPDDLQLLYAVGDLLGMAVERARLFAQSAQIGALEERNRLAREIHDTLAQSMTAVTLQLEAADALLELHADSGQARAAIQRALTLTQANLEEARRSVLDLRAAPLEGRSLAEALRELAEGQAALHGLALDYRATGVEQPLAPRIAVGMYRIAQAAIANVARHAAARLLTVQLMVLPDQVRMQISDDGVGFDSAVVANGRFGLVGMRERARLLDGTLQLASAPQIGTQISVVVPTAAPPANQ